MSTRETPAEARLAESLTPSRTAVPTTGMPSPGIALAAARVPGSPTLPDWDPASMAVLMTRMASEMLVPEAAPPMSPAAGVHENAMAQLQPPVPQVLTPAQTPVVPQRPPAELPDPSEPAVACAKCESVAVYVDEDEALVCADCGAVLTMELTELAAG